ncbi:MAG TPA: hypothetical protein VH165_36330 [Kofleriaceae bacterium]|jgi:hypothetical protein|nr:hypothetical protein [Kofleriaceae bacterium]
MTARPRPKMTRALVILAVICAAAGPAAASHCTEVSPIVGRQHCGSFGSRWAHRWWMGLYIYDAAFVVDRVALPAFNETGTVYSPSGPASYRAQLAAGAHGPLYTAGTRLRIGYRGEHFTLGAEVVPTFMLGAPTLETQIEGQPLAHDASGEVYDVLGVAGVHTRVTHALDVGAELGLGVREVLLFSSLPGGYTTCEGGATGKSCGFSVSDSRLLVELRARADLWIRPHATLGAAIGVDLSGRGESLSINLAYHLSAFDGA